MICRSIQLAILLGVFSLKTSAKSDFPGSEERYRHKNIIDLVKFITTTQEQQTEAFRQMKHELTQNYRQLEMKFQRLERKYHDVELRNSILEQKPKNDKRQRPTQNVVAFTATVSSPNLIDLSPGQTIIFDNVITNVGDSYNKTYGRFVAPLSGVYVFNMVLMVSPGQREYLEMVVDGRPVIPNYAAAFNVTDVDFVSSSRILTIELNKGSKVWIRSMNQPYHGTGQIHGNNYTMFGGWLYSV